MSASLSSYLNIIRLVAAVLVYFYHAGHFSGIRFPVLSELGQEAVVVFFVLSGFVITFSAMAKPTTARSFALDRLARLWSVMLPALALTVVADLLGQSLALEVYGALQPYDLFKWVASIGINTAFMSQIWFLSIWPGSNGPFWSISYEFWFYVIFGIAMFARGKSRLLLLGAAVVIAGPAILGAFPVWVLGVALFLHLRSHPGASKHVAWCLWLLTWIAAGVAMWADVGASLSAAFPTEWAFAKWGVNFWPMSYSLGLLVTLNIYAFSGMNAFGDFMSRYSRRIRIAADTSFGLYLFHYPLLYVTKAVLTSLDVDGSALGWTVLVVPLVISISLAHWCEGLKPLFRRTLERLAMRPSSALRAG